MDWIRKDLSQKPCNIISRLTNKTEKRITVPLPLFLGVIPNPCFLLISIYRGYMRVHIKSEGFKFFQNLCKLHEKIKIELGNRWRLFCFEKSYVYA